MGAFVNLVLNCDKSLEEKERLLMEFLEKLQQTESEALKRDLQAEALKRDFQGQLLEKDIRLKDEKIRQITKEYEKVEIADKRFY